MKINSLAAAVLVLGSAPLMAQMVRLPAFNDIKLADIRPAPIAASAGSVESLLKVLASNVSLEEKIKAVGSVQSTDLRDFEYWGGRMDPQTEFQVALSLKNVVEWPAAPMSTRFMGVAVFGRIGRWFRYSAAQDTAIDTLKTMAFMSSSNDPQYGLGREALLVLASMAKAAPIRGMDPQWPEKVVTLSEDILTRYMAGVVSDQIPMEAFAGLAVLHNYLEFNLQNNAEGNREGDWLDRVERMPSMSSSLTSRLSSVLLDPVERDLERLYSDQNTYFRGYLVATMIDLGRVEMLDPWVREKLHRILTNMASHRESNPKIYYMLAPYRNHSL